MTIKINIIDPTNLSRFGYTREGLKFIDNVDWLGASYTRHHYDLSQFVGKLVSGEALSKPTLLGAYTQTSKNSDYESTPKLITINNLESNLCTKNAANNYNATVANYKEISTLNNRK